MIKLRKSEERGHADHGWLNTYHTFSFNTYHDREHMGFSHLRVINDDRVAPGMGFGSHPHNDMEIITYILDGELEHKDSMGNGSVIKAGDVQRMSAGSGVVHSEFNPSKENEVHLLQIWIFPDQKGLEPSYEQISVSRDQKLGQLRLIASPDGADNSTTIHQDAKIFATILEKDQEIEYQINIDRSLWIHVAKGKALLNDLELSAGDGAAISDESEINLKGLENAEIILFDLK